MNLIFFLLTNPEQRRFTSGELIVLSCNFDPSLKLCTIIQVMTHLIKSSVRGSAMYIIAADLIQIGNDRNLLRHGLWYGLLILCVNVIIIKTKT
jgi:hypothetical protein